MIYGLKMHILLSISQHDALKLHITQAVSVLLYTLINPP